MRGLWLIPPISSLLPAWWAPWVPVVGGAVGGLTALAGQGLTHFLTARRENTRRKEELEAKELADLKAAYVVYLAELREEGRGAAHPAIRERLEVGDARNSEPPATAGVRVMPTSGSACSNAPEHRGRIEKAGKADEDLISMAVGDACNIGQLAGYLNNALIETNKFQEWVYTDGSSTSVRPYITRKRAEPSPGLAWM